MFDKGYKIYFDERLYFYEGLFLDELMFDDVLMLEFVCGVMFDNCLSFCLIVFFFYFLIMVTYLKTGFPIARFILALIVYF